MSQTADQDFSPQTYASARDVLRMLRPRTAIGQSKTRVGRQFDGGYVMLDSFDDVGVAYSFGINDDVSWDLQMARRGVKVFQYDHTIASLPAEHELFNWKKFRIDGVTDEEEGQFSIADLIQMNGHVGRKDMILKCDIEGSEWLALRLTSAQTLKQFKQIVLELHNLDFLNSSGDVENVRTTIANLTTHHNVVHVHGNNYAPWSVVGGMPVPNVIEVTLARKADFAFELSTESFPGPLDMPCCASRADMYLGRFSFD